jgi:hypothetical protein
LTADSAEPLDDIRTLMLVSSPKLIRTAQPLHRELGLAVLQFPPGPPPDMSLRRGPSIEEHPRGPALAVFATTAISQEQTNTQGGVSSVMA